MHIRRFLFTLFAAVALSPPFLTAQSKTSGTIPSTGGGASCVSINIDAQATVAVQVTGTWTGTLQPKISIQGQTPANAQVTPSTSTTPASTITANGVYRGSVAGGSTFLLCGNTVASGTANVYLNASVASAGNGAGGSTGSSSFDSLTSGVNVSAAMQVGSGASMTPTGSGIITATSLNTPINNQTASYQLVAADAGGLVRMNVASANTVTVAPDATVNFPAGTAITIRQVGAGQTTIVAGGGVTISTPSSLAVRVQNASVEVIKVAANTWDLIGDTQ